MVAVPGLAGRVEIVRDRSGIPHIFAGNDEDALFAEGYVHAQDRLWLMEYQRRLGQGRLAEILPDERALEADRFVRTVGIGRAAAADLVAMDADCRRAVEPYSRGVTAFIESHRDKLPLEFSILNFPPEPWQPVDSLVWAMT